MRAKLVNENIKHLSPKELNKEELLSMNWERVKKVFNQTLTSPWSAKNATQEDKDNLKIVIDTLTELEIIVDAHFSSLGFYILQLEHLGKYKAKFAAFFLPINYGINPGIEIHVGSLRNRDSLHSTMDMQYVKDFVNRFK